MERELNRLYPPPSARMPLPGLYLEHHLRQYGNRERPYVYSNFVSSLDGRIGISAAGRSTHSVPAAIANPRDWRLYQELAAHADILITSGRYFRQSALGEAQDTLPVGPQDEFTDIRAWRLQQGLSAQPDLAIMSASLELPAEALAIYRKRRILVITGQGADPARIGALQQQDIEVLFAGTGLQVDGKSMIDQLGEAGYSTIYSIAGPSVFHTLLQSRRLDRLYLTQACTLLGGDDYDTLTWGSQFIPPVNMQLAELYHDPWAPAGTGQLLACFDVSR